MYALVNVIIGMFSAENQLLSHITYAKNYFGDNKILKAIIYNEIRDIKQNSKLIGNRVNVDFFIELLVVFVVYNTNKGNIEYKVHIERLQKNLQIDILQYNININTSISYLKASNKINNTVVNVNNSENGDIEIALFTSFESYITKEDTIDIPQVIIKQKHDAQKNVENTRRYNNSITLLQDELRLRKISDAIEKLTEQCSYITKTLNKYTELTNAYESDLYYIKKLLEQIMNIIYKQMNTNKFNTSISGTEVNRAIHPETKIS